MIQKLFLICAIFAITIPNRSQTMSPVHGVKPDYDLLFLIDKNLQQGFSSEWYIIQDSTVIELFNRLTGLWEISAKRYYSYDSELYTLNFIEYKKQGDSNDWIPSVKLDYPSFTYSSWDIISGGWQDSLKIEYNDDGYVSYLWNKIEGEWNRWIKAVNEYDNWGDIVEISYYRWEYRNSEWVLDSRTRYYSGIYGETEYRENWNESEGIWEESEKIEYFFDDNYDLELIEYYLWDSAGESYDIYRKDEYSYSEPSGYYGYISEVTTSERDPSSGIWVYSERQTAYFSQHFISGIKSIKQEEMVIYPNPFCDHVNIVHHQITGPILFEVLDIDGKTIVKQHIKSDNQIFTGDLKPGVYLYRIYTDKGLKTGKIIKINH